MDKKSWDTVGASLYKRFGGSTVSQGKLPDLDSVLGLLIHSVAGFHAESIVPGRDVREGAVATVHTRCVWIDHNELGLCFGKDVDAPYLCP